MVGIVVGIVKLNIDLPYLELLPLLRNIDLPYLEPLPLPRNADLPYLELLPLLRNIDPPYLEPLPPLRNIDLPYPELLPLSRNADLLSELDTNPPESEPVFMNMALLPDTSEPRIAIHKISVRIPRALKPVPLSMKYTPKKPNCHISNWLVRN